MGVRRRRSPGARATGGSVPRRNCPDQIWVSPNKEPTSASPHAVPDSAMALIDCPECAADVSEHAERCPHCGYPFEEPSGPDKGGVVLTDIDIGFNDWAVILLKAGLAAFPVAIIAVLLYFVLTIAGTALVGGIGG